MSEKLTHIDAKGEARMVDVSDKAATARTAAAEGFVSMAPETLALLQSGAAPKGDVLATAVPGFPVWDLAGLLGSTGWGLWVAALGVSLLIRSGRRESSASDGPSVASPQFPQNPGRQ